MKRTLSGLLKKGHILRCNHSNRPSDVLEVHLQVDLSLNASTLTLFQQALSFLFALAVFFCSSHARAQGGPPLVTDDPETPGDGHWEINVAEQSTSSVSSLIQAPYFDFNYGWGGRIQLKLETGGALLTGDSSGAVTGWGNALAGVKWRFIEDEPDGLLISTYPQVGFPSFFTSANNKLASSGSTYFVPIELAKHFGEFAINPEFGFLFNTQAPNQYVSGIVLAYRATKKLELLSEVHGNSYVDGSGTQILFNIGARYDLSEGLSLIGSAGETFEYYAGDPKEDFTYAGVQIRL